MKMCNSDQPTRALTVARPSRRLAPRRLAILLLLVCGSNSAAWATQPCGGEPGWSAETVQATVQRGDRFAADVGPRTLVLEPTDTGWQIGMTRDGLDVPIFAPPLRPVETNPLNIAGWHFRNKANTGPNTGDVNAPQHLRRFRFGTLAIDPEVSPGVLGHGEADGGLGDLRLTELHLTPARQGEKAAITSMSFTGCLVWLTKPDRLPPIIDADPGVAFDAAVAEMKGCGLDTATYRLSDRMAGGSERGQAPMLRPDLDRDNIPDLVIPVTRRSDGAPGLALCLIGDETLLLAGYAGRIGAHLDPGYFASADWWRIHQGPIRPGAGEGSPPRLRGDALLLGKDDSSSVILYLDEDGALNSYWQGD